MAIEGPLRELGIHDVFQLLDLSRKTGALRVTSDLRDDEGVVLFDGGRVIHASVRSHPTSIERILRHAGKVSDADMAVAASLEPLAGEGLGDRLVRAGVITQRELERQLRLAIESVVYSTQTPQGTAAIDARAKEHIANFALGGMALGLVGAGILTRSLDTPPLPVAPTITQAPTGDGRTATIYGVAGTW